MNPEVNFALIIIILILLIYIYTYINEINKLKEYVHSINLLSFNWGLKNSNNDGPYIDDNNKKKATKQYKESYKKLTNWYNSKSAEDIKNVSFSNLEEKGKNYGSFIAGGKTTPNQQ